MAQRGRPKKIFTEEKNNFLTEEKNLKIDNSPRVDMSDAVIAIRKVVKYSPNGWDVVTLQPGMYNASELDPIVLKLHKRYDDDYLSQLENSAFNLMNTYLNRTIITDLNAELTDNDIAYNDQLKIAELMIIDSFYNDRSAEKIPGAAIFILNQFRIAQA